MVAFVVLVVGAWAQWKAYRLCLAWAVRPVTSKEVGEAFREMSHRDPVAMAAWAEQIRPSPWDATGELPVANPLGTVQPRLGEG